MREEERGKRKEGGGKRKEARGKEEVRFPKCFVPFSLWFKYHSSDHLPIRFATYWRALFQTLMQNWQLMIRAK